MRSPFNWVGNKYKYVGKINKVLEDRNYKTVHDVFLGSGNILVNLDIQANFFVGNDIVPLLPNVYNTMVKEKEEDFTTGEFEEIISGWNNFSDKKDYYGFRDYWNTKYLSKQYDRFFICETILLLKMCSNSMVRFNRKKGYFNQGFRGIAKNKTRFFSEVAINNIVNSLNKFSYKLSTKNILFKSEDFKKALSLVDKDDLVILDPPYILSEGMYGADFMKKDDNHILSFLETTEADFILFNYLSSGDKINETLKRFVENNEVKVDILSNQDGTGQGRKGSKKIQEVMVYKID